MEAESRTEVGEGDVESVFSGDRKSIWKDERVLEMDSRNVCTTMWMYLKPLNCTHKNGKV